MRYVLSDGAGAAVIENAPAASGISLRIDWVSLTSFANTENTCMYGGSNSNSAMKSWLDYPTSAAAAADGAFVLRQDLSLLPHLVSVGADEWERLCKLGKFDGHADLDPRALLKRADEGDRLQRVRPAR
jgi:3-oxoacyl-[acyl-carrier-protein] synthase-3